MKEYIKPQSDMNKTALPSWIKKIDAGKISVKEASDTERIIEFSGEKVRGLFLAKRENINSDFWTLNKFS